MIICLNQPLPIMKLKGKFWLEQIYSRHWGKQTSHFKGRVIILKGQV